MKKLSESVWGDIHKRAKGEQVRKEDDINHLDRDGLYDLIYSIYDNVHPYPAPSKGQTTPEYKSISLPLFQSMFKIYRVYIAFVNNKIDRITLLANDLDIKDFKQSLIDKFNLTFNDNGSLEVTAKDDTVSNQVCMDLIETVVENAPAPLLKKRD